MRIDDPAGQDSDRWSPAACGSPRGLTVPYLLLAGAIVLVVAGGPALELGAAR